MVVGAYYGRGVDFKALIFGGIMNCDKCLLRKVQYNKNIHIIVCGLPLDKARECKIGKKSHYVSIIKENKDEQK